MAFQKAIRSNVVEHKNDNGEVVAISVEFKVWDSKINPFEAGDGNDNARLLEIYVTPQEYADIWNAPMTNLEKRQALRDLVKGKLKEAFLAMTSGRRVPQVQSPSAATTLLGSDTIGSL